MEEELNYSTVVFKNAGTHPKETKEDSSIYSTVKVEKPVNTPPNAETAAHSQHVRLLAVCFGLLCVLSLVSVGVIIHFKVKMDEQETNFKATINSLKEENQQLITSRSILQTQRDNLNWTLGVILNFDTFPVNGYCPQKIRVIMYEQEAALNKVTAENQQLITSRSLLQTQRDNLNWTLGFILNFETFPVNEYCPQKIRVIMYEQEAALNKVTAENQQLITSRSLLQTQRDNLNWTLGAILNFETFPVNEYCPQKIRVIMHEQEAALNKVTAENQQLITSRSILQTQRDNLNWTLGFILNFDTFPVNEYCPQKIRVIMHEQETNFETTINSLKEENQQLITSRSILQTQRDNLNWTLGFILNFDTFPVNGYCPQKIRVIMHEQEAALNKVTAENQQLITSRSLLQTQRDNLNWTLGFILNFETFPVNEYCPQKIRVIMHEQEASLNKLTAENQQLNWTLGVILKFDTFPVNGYCPQKNAEAETAAHSQHFRLLAVCFGLLCVLSLVSVGVIIHFKVKMDEQETNFKATINSLKEENQQLITSRSLLQTQRDNLNWTLGVILNFDTFPVNEYCPQKIKVKMDEQETNFKATINSLTAENQQLNWTLGVILNFDTFPVNEYCPQKKCQQCQTGWIQFQQKCYLFYENPAPWKTWHKVDSFAKTKLQILLLLIIYKNRYWVKDKLSTTGIYAMLLPDRTVTANWNRSDHTMQNKFICEREALIWSN
ncbi:hypothetical protein Q5P01_011635 [Channa striata]|uniref:Uncharacterized protein n=1 Tax=Channa striata TaxID=64152 RepID=A0AA88SPE0_CHASR|nr:hypothetical protein Q5P01_011635 [Channa striata]